MKALTFKIRFFTAQFKDHTSKMVRKTYLIPPPSAVAGIFGAITGLKRDRLAGLGDRMMAGAELISLGGRIVTLARLFKLDRTRRELSTLLRKYYTGSYSGEKGGEWVLRGIAELLTIKESEELYMPEYKFAIALGGGAEPLLEEGLRRLRDLDFEYEVFGGNDYHFVESIGDPRRAEVYNSRDGHGYCPREDLERIETESFNIAYGVSAIGGAGPIIMPATFLVRARGEGVDAKAIDYIQVYGARIIAKRELTVVDDGESKIFVYEVAPFLVAQI